MKGIYERAKKLGRKVDSYGASEWREKDAGYDELQALYKECKNREQQKRVREAFDSGFRTVADEEDD
jgi:predicted secreted protein